MARAGDVLEHPRTGELIVWLKVAGDTDGRLLEGDMFARPGGHPAVTHVPYSRGCRESSRHTRMRRVRHSGAGVPRRAARCGSACAEMCDWRAIHGAFTRGRLGTALATNAAPCDPVPN